MFQVIGSFLDSVVMIGGGVVILTQLKNINKPYVKWLAIALMAMGVLLAVAKIFN